MWAYRAALLVAGTAFLAFTARGLSLAEFSALQFILVGASLASALGKGVAKAVEAGKSRFFWYSYLFLSTALVPLGLLIALACGLYAAGPNPEVLALLSVYVALSTALWGIIGPVRMLKPGLIEKALTAFEVVKLISAFILVVELRYGISGALLSLILARIVEGAILGYRSLPRKTFLDMDLVKEVPLKWEAFFLPFLFYFMTVDVFVVAHTTGRPELVAYYRPPFILAFLTGLSCLPKWKEGVKVAVPAAVFMALSMNHITALLGPSYTVLNPLGPLVATLAMLFAMNMVMDEELVEGGTALKILLLQNPIYLFTLYIIFREWGGSMMNGILSWLGTLTAFLVASIIVKWFILSKEGRWPVEIGELRKVALAASVEGVVLSVAGFLLLRPAPSLPLQGANLALLALAGGAGYYLALKVEHKISG